MRNGGSATRGSGTGASGLYKGADGRYRSAGTFGTKERALEVTQEAERHALIAGGAGGLDSSTRATRTIKEYAPLFLRHHQVEGNTKDAYADTLRLHVVPPSEHQDWSAPARLRAAMSDRKIRDATDWSRS